MINCGSDFQIIPDPVPELRIWPQKLGQVKQCWNKICSKTFKAFQKNVENLKKVVNNEHDHMEV